ncbi:MAG: hypothetical protein M3Y30_04760 [Gemmatimonadota bacterium]|nr:hypothetical protein [Gemmatimonadota bacterium]
MTDKRELYFALALVALVVLFEFMRPDTGLGHLLHGLVLYSVPLAVAYAAIAIEQTIRKTPAPIAAARAVMFAAYAGFGGTPGINGSVSSGCCSRFSHSK